MLEYVRQAGIIYEAVFTFWPRTEVDTFHSFAATQEHSFSLPVLLVTDSRYFLECLPTLSIVVQVRKRCHTAYCINESVVLVGIALSSKV